MTENITRTWLDTTTTQMSPTISKLATAQAKMQAEVKDLPTNAKGYGYKYCTLDTMVKALRPLLSKHGLSYVQMPIGNGDTIGVQTLYMHTSGEWICSTVSSRIVEPNSPKLYQSVGSAITYYKRYSLSSFVGIAADEDNDGVVPTTSPKKPQPKMTALTKAQQKELKELMVSQADDFKSQVVQGIGSKKINQENFNKYKSQLVELNKANKKETK